MSFNSEEYLKAQIRRCENDLARVPQGDDKMRAMLRLAYKWLGEALNKPYSQTRQVEILDHCAWIVVYEKKLS